MVFSKMLLFQHLGFFSCVSYGDPHNNSVRDSENSNLPLYYVWDGNFS